MPRLTTWDMATIVALAVAAIGIGGLALTGHSAWAMALLALLVGVVGILARVQFAARRQDLRAQKHISESIRTEVSGRVAPVTAQLRALSGQLGDLRSSVESVRAEMARTAELTREVEAIRADTARMAEVAPEIEAIRSEIRGMRVAQQLISQTITATSRRVSDVAEVVAHSVPSTPRDGC